MSAGYSGTPLPSKLGIRAGQRIAFLDAPAEFAVALGELPEGVGAPRTTLRGPEARDPADGPPAAVEKRSAWGDGSQHVDPRRRDAQGQDRGR
jgi:hypothetical protein